MKATVPGNGIFLKFETLRAKLKELIYEQDEAVEEVVDAFIHKFCKPGESPPKAIFTFLGPHGAGKSYLAKLLANLSEDEFGDYKQFDMSQYTAPEDIERLMAQKVGEGGVQDGELTGFLRKHPKSIVVFTNIEKADNQVQLALLELLTDTDMENGLDTRETVIIFTSVLGSALYQNREFMRNFRENRLRSQSLIIDALSKEKKSVFDMVQPSLATKLIFLMSQNSIVLFRRLSLESMVRIGAETLRGLSEHFAKTTHIEMSYQPLESIVRLMILSFAPYINIKRIQQKMPDVLLDKITRFIRETKATPQKIVFGISKQVRDFLKTHKPESKTLVQQMMIRNETAELTWKARSRGERLGFVIEKAEFKPLLSSALLREELPVIRYSNIGFQDIAGNVSIKKILKEIITVLKQPEKVKEFRIDMPKGMLLYGPEGMGKTMLGKAFAKEAGLPYIYVSGGEIFDPNYLCQVYQKAKNFAPSIVFLDEIDTKGILEGVVTTMPSDQLTTELDAISSSPEEFVFTMATAQDKNAVSPEIIAPGRIDIFVEVPEFDMEARRFFIEEILKKPHDGKINIDKVVRYISGMSGYDLERIGKEASLYAIRKNSGCITEDILIEQINNIKYGHKLDTKRIRNFEEEIRRTACHEAAHAVLSYILLPHIKIEQVTIAPRYETLGFVSYSAEEFANNATKEEIFNNVCVMLAGRTSQIKKFGLEGIDSGASNDLEQATFLSYIAIASMGMDEEIGYVHADTLRQNVSKQMFQSQIEQRIRNWIKEAKAKTEVMVEQNWEKIEKLAAILVEQEIVDGAELEKIMKN